MSTPVIGWLPYGSSHTSVILQSPLTSEASITSPLIGDAGVLEAATTPVGDTNNILFDPVLGMNPSNNGGALFTQLGEREKLNYGGQITLEVQRPFLHRFAADEANTNTNAAIETLISWLMNGSRRGLVEVKADQDVNFYASDSDTSKVYSSNADADNGEDGFDLLNIGWNMGKIYISINGLLLEPSTRTEYSAVAPTKYFMWKIRIGLAAISQVNPIINTYVRNLQASYQPPIFPSHPYMARVSAIGTSRIFGYGYDSTEFKDATVLPAIDRGLSKRGIYLSDRIGNYGANNAAVYDGADVKILTNVTNSLADKANWVIYCGGTNDAAIYGTNIATDFEADIKGHLTTLLAEPYNRGVIVERTPTIGNSTGFDTATYRGYVNAILVIIDALPAWWDAANPLDTGRIYLADTFTAFGGHNLTTASQYFKTGELHENAKGSVLRGQVIEKVLARAMRKS